MELFKLSDLKGGWFAGNFEPTLHKTSDFEVAVKQYKKYDYEKRHYHKIATEFTVIVYGEVRMNNIKYEAGDVVRIDPGEATDFYVLSDIAITTVLKTPSVANDKYISEN
ncbi:MAG TPA: hypothetical protein VJ765_09515 [Chitinophagaceae bacterium]|nr:hypothetical protein [Chitinophagaceae bacterium]